VSPESEIRLTLTQGLHFNFHLGQKIFRGQNFLKRFCVELNFDKCKKFHILTFLDSSLYNTNKYPKWHINFKIVKKICFEKTGAIAHCPPPNDVPALTTGRGIKMG